MNPNFRWFVEEASKVGIKDFIVRSNLTIMRSNTSYHDLPDFFKSYNIHVVSSMPHWTKGKTDKQRGTGVFDKSIKALQELNGTPKEIITNPKLMKLLLPTLRADFEAAENYQYNQSEHPLACPIVAFGGSDDPHVSQEGLAGWGSQTSSRFKSISFPGDHFYLNAAEDEVVQLIAKEMMYSRSVNHNPR